MMTTHHSLLRGLVKVQMYIKEPAISSARQFEWMDGAEDLQAPGVKLSEAEVCPCALGTCELLVLCKHKKIMTGPDTQICEMTNGRAQEYYRL
mgnify:CR=1 FL=1